jgi:hypothetical protein
MICIKVARLGIRGIVWGICTKTEVGKPFVVYFATPFQFVRLYRVDIKGDNWMNWNGFGRKRWWPNFKAVSRSSHGGTEKNHERFSQDSRSPDRRLNTRDLPNTKECWKGREHLGDRGADFKRNIIWGSAVDSSGSRYDPIADCCEHGNETSSFRKGGEFIDRWATISLSRTLLRGKVRTYLLCDVNPAVFGLYATRCVPPCAIQQWGEPANHTTLTCFTGHSWWCCDQIVSWVLQRNRWASAVDR